MKATWSAGQSVAQQEEGRLGIAERTDLGLS